MYQALYRKWRPRTFDDVVGQTHITETIKRQLAAGRPSHAYLFTGTRGTGKTTCAKILARAVNCEHPIDGNPCNACPSCFGIENGSILDVLELDAASNNGVDQIRALRDEAIYTPAAVKKRVYIVDEVHMLSLSAFNALLKILEEPPSHLMFILATTELHKVPATIKSRCQQFAFKRIPPTIIADRLTYIAGQEGIPLTPAASDLLSRLADGGLRDALSLLDQCSGIEGDLTEEVVLETLGLAGNRNTAQILTFLAAEDTTGALTTLNTLYEDGKDMGALLGELSSLIRDLLLRKTAPNGGKGLLLGGYEDNVLHSLSDAFTAAELVQMMTILQAAQADLYRSTSRRLDAELCLIRLCDRRLADDREGILARLSRLEENTARGGGIPAATHLPSAEPRQKGRAEETVQTAPTVPPEAESENLTSPMDDDLPPWDLEPDKPVAPKPQKVEQKRKPEAVLPTMQKKIDTPPPASSQINAPQEPKREGEWLDFLKTLPKMPPVVHSFLHKPENVTGTFEEQTLTLWVDSETTKAFLSRGDTPSVLEKAAETYTGTKHRLILKVGKPEYTQPTNAAGNTTPQREDKLSSLMQQAQKLQNFTVK